MKETRVPFWWRQEKMLVTITVKSQGPFHPSLREESLGRIFCSTPAARNGEAIDHQVTE